MSAATDTSIHSLRAFMRAVPPLSAEDSLGRFVRVCRQCACSSLPVLYNNRVVGIVRQSDVLPLLQERTGTEIEAVLARPLAELMRPADVVADASLSPAEALHLFARHNFDLMHALPVIDDAGYSLGIVVYNDLLASDNPVCRPGSIGGMATPFGVYLTDGTVQAGVGNLALVASGIVIGMLLLVSVNCVDYGMQFVQHYVSLPPGSDLLDVGDMGAHLPPAVSLLGFTLKLLMYLLFFSLMRVTNLAGYHAAEHQTVHALERNERLIPEIVRRMPRPHPRCGTNLMAIGLILFTACPLLVSVAHLDTESALIGSAVLTLFTWRAAGTFLQAHFTTRPATERQIESGIAAARALLGTYYSSPPVRPNLLRRVWCMGIVQNGIGVSLASGAFYLMTLIYVHFSHH